MNDAAQTLRTLEGHTGGVWALAVCPSGRFLYSGSDDHTVRHWAVDTWTVSAAMARESREWWCGVARVSSPRCVADVNGPGV